MVLYERTQHLRTFPFGGRRHYWRRLSIYITHNPHLQWSYFSPEAHLIMKIKKGPPHPPRCWKDQRARLISRSPWSKKSGLYSMWFCYGKKPTRFCSLPIILNLVWKINKRCLSFRNTSCYHKKSTRISRGTTSGSIWKINKSCLTVTWRCPVLFIFQWVCSSLHCKPLKAQVPNSKIP